MQRDFDISDVLSVTTGALVSTRHVDGIYDIMGFVTGDSVISTIGLAMMAESVKQEVLKQHPQLAGVSFPDIETVPKVVRAAFIAAWLAEKAEQFGKTLSIASSNAPHSVSLEEQIGYVKRINPDVEIIGVVRP